MFKPINKHLIVKVTREVKKSLIVKPEAFQIDEVVEGVVLHEIVAVSEGSDLFQGSYAVYLSHVGSKYFPVGNQKGDAEYRIIREEDLLGVESGVKKSHEEVVKEKYKEMAKTQKELIESLEEA
tara:strand:+ start:2324 stop:2695 length:372 start_codon:yes stop_codon:yes gene_type:complete